MPFMVLQLTDPHLGARWSDDPAAALASAIATVNEMPFAPPDAVIVTGDIANAGADAEYEQARRLLDRLGAPVYALPGNHDDREALQRHFDLPATADGSLSYVADLGPVRLVALDTVRPGQDGGQLDAARLAWLDRILNADQVTPTLVAMHHPPLLTGIPAMDAIGFGPGERDALAEIVARHGQVQLIAAGHVHRTIVGELGGAAILAIPSTDAQLALDFEADELRFVREPACFAVHVLVDGRLVSHIQPLGPSV
jgi:3',5'-cyclic-AMP phosphodiesterase